MRKIFVAQRYQQNQLLTIGLLLPPLTKRAPQHCEINQIDQQVDR